ncbi:LIM and calponin homology domains-containing protein 1-like isoform X2 [Parambassis ranga]|uniref:LIM and calponin homology domains-containing protein 1-like isoform X2 n=1 Tax=Parambassis ranga TaxID=210632 RepID=A0A6P7J472_9TELE|nr:LIM and calponin homology domains-containing protein 1-like isoform X2 [Parambassis ranga]
MRKEAEEAESPKRSIRDSGYIDCWDSERSDSLSPPRHGREDSFDSLDSFGSRSRQTPSPDVLVARGSSDGRGSDSESDGPSHRKMPDVHKDDMLARRTSISEPRTAMPFNQYLPNKSNQSGYVPTPLRKKKNDKEDGGHKSWSTATSPVGGDRRFSIPARSCSVELFHHSTTPAPNAVAAQVIATSPVSTSGKHPPVTEQKDVGLRKGLSSSPAVADAEGDDRGTTLSPMGFLPVPSAMASISTATTETSRRKGRTLSERDDPNEGTSWVDSGLPATFSHTDSVSDDPQSVSMIDMRSEDEAILTPHSQERHELMHNQYNQMKEEEDHWQDDLARWKNRRRSISQDLIKKQEERKTMEQLMSGDGCISQRRRSIKTYREIVQDKERREEELRLAYKRARSPEEAATILQRYAQRFSISETVLERLQLPKLLDRSISADPSFPCSPFPISLSASPTSPEPVDMDPNGPMRYLRQQSAPVPKFTSTFEAQIEEFPKDLSTHQRPQIRSHSSEPPSTQALSPKPVPLLTPKPYFHSRPTSDAWNNKVDGLLRLNGDMRNDDSPTTPENQGRESPLRFQACPPETRNGTIDASSAASPRHTCAEAEDSSPTKAGKTQGGTEAASEDIQEEHLTPLSRPTSLPAELQKPEESFGKTGGQEEPNAAVQQAPPAEAKQEQEKTETSSESLFVQAGVNTQQDLSVTSQARALVSQECSQRTEMNAAALGSFGYHPPKESTAEDLEKDCSENEKYQREQEKLKEEWEKAQREVAEEERKYHEEERRILEETVAPLTPRSSALPSPSRGELSSAAGPQDTIVRSLADWERKQELLERQSRGSTESAEWKRKENDRTSDISTADDSMKTGRSSMSQSTSQADTVLQNGQKLPQMPTKSSTPVKKQQPLTADNKPSRPAGDRRSGPIDNNIGRSSSKLPAACPSPPDTLPPPPNRSVSGKKLCSSCGQPLGKGAAMIIETLSLYFHIHCFKCGVCKGQLGDTTTGTDVRIRNGLLNCHQCYIRSRSAGQPTTL